jgi:mannose-6-phosphate isomerase-like protein (cupin superfamily)
LLVGEDLVTVQPNEFLQVRAGVPHAIVKGEGVIEHFILRFPAVEDKRVLSKLPTKFPPPLECGGRTLQRKWGCRVSVDESANRDCWLFGVGQAKFHSLHMCLAFMRYPTQKFADQYRHAYHHCYHAHLESWEFYTVLQGVKVLRIGDEIIPVQAGEILQVNPGVKHVFHEMVAPFEGFTFRTPLVEDKVEYS